MNEVWAALRVGAVGREENGRRLQGDVAPRDDVHHLQRGGKRCRYLVRPKGARRRMHGQQYENMRTWRD